MWLVERTTYIVYCSLLLFVVVFCVLELVLLMCLALATFWTSRGDCSHPLTPTPTASGNNHIKTTATHVNEYTPACSRYCFEPHAGLGLLT